MRLRWLLPRSQAATMVSSVIIQHDWSGKVEMRTSAHHGTTSIAVAALIKSIAKFYSTNKRIMGRI